MKKSNIAVGGVPKCEFGRRILESFSKQGLSDHLFLLPPIANILYHKKWYKTHIASGEVKGYLKFSFYLISTPDAKPIGVDLHEKFLCYKVLLNFDREV